MTNSRPWDWPSVWARDEDFWRETASLTIAGMLTVILLGVPTVIYLMLAGQMKPEVGFPILIGVAMFILAIFLYWLIRRLIRWIPRRIRGGRNIEFFGSTLWSAISGVISAVVAGLVVSLLSSVLFAR